jgi:hypothetical protein
LHVHISKPGAGATEAVSPVVAIADGENLVLLHLEPDHDKAY